MRNNLIKMVECVSVCSIERKSRVVDLKTGSRTRHPRERGDPEWRVTLRKQSSLHVFLTAALLWRGNACSLDPRVREDDESKSCGQARSSMFVKKFIPDSSARTRE